MTEPGKVTEMDALDDLFAQARTADPVPGPALLARIMTDAVRTDQNRQLAAFTARPAARTKGWLATMQAALGGWPAIGGLTMATVTGLWIGVAAPDSLSVVAGAFWGEAVTISLDPEDDMFGLEG